MKGCRIELKEPINNSRPVFSTKTPELGQKILRTAEEDSRASEFGEFEAKQRRNSDWIKGAGGRVEKNRN